jgi:pimeloyl-ACP methyl ester carboxylesterase
MQGYSEIHFTSRDGLRLYARHYRVAGAHRRPLLCLAGLTRNSRDFHDLARALATPDADGRNVYALDYRGRGRSQHDPNWRNYSILIELNDVLDFMIVKGLQHAAVIGTSRGGILAMLMAVIRPASVGAVILNDIGPVIEADGLSRIAAYVGRGPLPADWAEATRMVRDINQRQFPAVPEAQWAELARQYFNDDNGLPSPAYDPALAKALAQMQAIPGLWPQFAALAKVPMLVLRGEHSDILSAVTLEDMRQRHPRLEAVTVSGEGHAPLLKDARSIRTIAAFLQRTDAEAAYPAAAA